MATWIAHLRIAENILYVTKDLNVNAFTAGSIAPDSGVPNEDWSSFNPPTNITHWKDNEGCIKPENFYSEYIDTERSLNDKELFSFVLGYYTHLLADVEWEKFYRIKKEDKIQKEGFSKDPNFIWKVKEDWYGQDFDYLKENKQSLFFTCFQHLTNVKDYLDYFPQGAFTERFKYIREMYLQNYKDSKREYIYLTKGEMDQYVDNATRNILDIFDKKCKVILLNDYKDRSTMR